MSVCCYKSDDLGRDTAATEYEPVPAVTEEESEMSEAFDDPGVGESDFDDMMSDDRRPFDLRISSMLIWAGSLL